MSVPDYLKEPSFEGRIYGSLVYDEEEKKFVLSGDPLMLEFAKRIFPGADIFERKNVKFRAGRKEISDLNWLLLRYPVDVCQCKDFLDRRRVEVIAQLEKRTSGHDMVPTVPPSEFRGKLYDFQKAAVTFMVNNKRCILGDEMGLGKTWSSLGAAAAAGEYPVLVVCQTHVQRQWQRMIGTLFDLPGDYSVGLFDSDFDVASKRGEALAPLLKSKTPYAIPDTPFSIIHYGLLGWWGQALRDRGYKTVIFDEVQELRHTGTRKYSEASLISSDAENVWGVSGTPVYGYGREIWCVLNAIEFHCLASEDAFGREWCVGYGERIVENPKALNEQLVKDGLLLRRRATDPGVAVELPKVIRNVQDLMHDEVVYDSLIGAARSKAVRYGEAYGFEKGRLAREIDNVARRACGISKAEYAAAFVESLINAGEVPLVYAWHHDVHDILVDKLSGFEPSVFTGKQSEAQKDDALKRFMEGKTNMALLSLRSAAGLDGLQYRATCCVFVELDWSPAIHSQCEGRIARIGVESAVKEVPSYYCVSSVGYDRTMIDVLGIKTGQFIGLMGDEPESFEEKREAEERAAERIKMLVERLTAEVVADGGES